MAGDSTARRREELGERLMGIESAGSKNDLISEINGALAVHAPMGDAEAIEQAAKRYRKAADTLEEDVRRPVDAVAKRKLPDVWSGTTALTAERVVDAASRAVDQMCVAFRDGSTALLRLSTAVAAAQEQDRRGRQQLREALRILGPEDGFFDNLVEKDEEEAAKNRARGYAAEGAKAMHAAAVTVDEAARATARDLNKLASEARAGHLAADGMGPVDRLMLADATSVQEGTDLAE